MSSYFKPQILTFLADGTTIVEGAAVKVGSARTNVALSTLVSDAILGIAQTVGANVGDPVEVAIAGGGAKALAGGTIAAGDYLTSSSTGALVTSTTTNDHVCAQALEAAVSGDLFAVNVIAFIHP